jgi:hypothetical protein
MSTVLSSEPKQSTTNAPVIIPNTLRSDVFKTNSDSFKHMPKCYQADQQAEYLCLQAEIDVLLQQLQTLRQEHSLK